MSRWIGDNSFARGAIRIIGLMSWHKRDHFAVSGAADANPLLPTGIVGGRRICVDHVQFIVLIDVQPARTPELLPFGEKLPVGVEDLKTRVRPIADEDAATRVDRQRMR